MRALDVPMLEKSANRRKRAVANAFRETGGQIPRKLESHRRLLAAARKLFAERGYHATTTLDIAREAGVVHGSFYTHFKDKTDCFLAFLNDAEEEVCQVMDWFSPTEDSSPSKMIRSWLMSAFSYSAANPGVQKALMTDIGVLSKNYKRRRKTNALGQKWIALAETWKKNGQAAPDFDSVLFAYLVTGAIRTGEVLATRNPKKTKAIVEELTRFMVRSINGN